MLDHYRWRDFVALPEDDPRELIDGRFVEVELPKRWHEKIVSKLIVRLDPWCEKRGWHVLASNFRVRISDRRGVNPDVQVLTDAIYRSNPEDGLEHGHPELVIEIISPTSKAHDRLRKVDWYASIGVPEYWIIDTEARSIERLALAGNTYRIAQHAEGDVVFRPKSFRGLSIDLRALWAAL